MDPENHDESTHQADRDYENIIRRADWIYIIYPEQNRLMH
jgi:hypothetical protein